MKRQRLFSLIGLGLSVVATPGWTQTPVARADATPLVVVVNPKVAYTWERTLQQTCVRQASPDISRQTHTMQLVRRLDINEAFVAAGTQGDGHAAGHRLAGLEQESSGLPADICVDAVIEGHYGWVGEGPVRLIGSPEAILHFDSDGFGTISSTRRLR